MNLFGFIYQLFCTSDNVISCHITVIVFFWRFCSRNNIPCDGITILVWLHIICAPTWSMIWSGLSSKTCGSLCVIFHIINLSTSNWFYTNFTILFYWFIKYQSAVIWNDLQNTLNINLLNSSKTVKTVKTVKDTRNNTDNNNKTSYLFSYKNSR